MKKSLALTLLPVALVASPVVFAADEQQSDKVAVVWESPEDYSDVRPANQSRKRFLEQTLNQLEKHFAKLGERLPANYQWNLTVTNLDLAGEVWPSSFVGLGHGADDVRVIKDIDIPRMSFSYQLTDAGQVVKEADVELKDMGFLQRSLRGFDSEPLRYEKRMLNEWFADEFSEQIAKN
ncbi:DUF3016 domain-containing protein [Alteromonas sp. ASW11-36]|uniref:DUF3016 domain-containing protein n=1 Tax=Alteromonas arenosi TaxID=3055817 RepID=A0ABT7SZV5_9ALTE|nr:DUF3016 domain-containing protein [Alteromonas sp. ASW11-36]MDM7861726.1 DUF3016 domain-containing protein [Alteromonas sp. ASW11-36]